jgi:hypothetical protein
MNTRFIPLTNTFGFYTHRQPPRKTGEETVSGEAESADQKAMEKWIATFLIGQL